MADHRNDYEDALIELLHGILPPEIDVIVLADRGFGDQIRYQHLELLGWDYVIRFRANILVTTAKGETKIGREWLYPTGRARMLRGARVTRDQTSVPAVVCVHAKRMKDPWMLATSLSKRTAAQVVKLYGRRFSIEETFRDNKDLRFGMGLSATRIRDTDRRDRILFLMAIAHALLTLLGAAGERCGLDRRLKANTVKRRTHSLYRQGRLWFELIPNMPDDRLETLITAFAEVVGEHAVFSETFGII
jgi:hypothetical protein